MKTKKIKNHHKSDKEFSWISQNIQKLMKMTFLWVGISTIAKCLDKKYRNINYKLVLKILKVIIKMIYKMLWKMHVPIKIITTTIIIMPVKIGIHLSLQNWLKNTNNSTPNLSNSLNKPTVLR